MELLVMAVLPVVTGVFDAASVVACTWLLWKVPAANTRFLQPKQFVDLALADALASATEVAAVTTTVLVSVAWLFFLRVRVAGGSHFRWICRPPPLAEADTRDVPLA